MRFEWPLQNDLLLPFLQSAKSASQGTADLTAAKRLAFCERRNFFLTPILTKDLYFFRVTFVLRHGPCFRISINNETRCKQEKCGGTGYGGCSGSRDPQCQHGDFSILVGLIPCDGDPPGGLARNL